MANIRDFDPSVLPELELKFWPRVEIKEPDECWLWRGLKDNDGYGRLRLAKVFKVAPSTIDRIATGELWKHVP